MKLAASWELRCWVMAVQALQQLRTREHYTLAVESWLSARLSVFQEFATEERLKENETANSCSTFSVRHFGLFSKRARKQSQNTAQSLILDMAYERDELEKSRHGK